MTGYCTTLMSSSTISTWKSIHQNDATRRSSMNMAQSHISSSKICFSRSTPSSYPSLWVVQHRKIISLITLLLTAISVSLPQSSGLLDMNHVTQPFFDSDIFRHPQGSTRSILVTCSWYSSPTYTLLSESRPTVCEPILIAYNGRRTCGTSTAFTTHSIYFLCARSNVSPSHSSSATHADIILRASVVALHQCISLFGRGYKGPMIRSPPRLSSMIRIRLAQTRTHTQTHPHSSNSSHPVGFLNMNVPTLRFDDFVVLS
ncbi:hypothetical protein QCA50_007250 [Cerrena zonata]|uniref:Uncharacterized protein n=1 Tax=Cerrena zonata TaxID=2478898 RepID=A0AAW0G7T3_9APHY